MKYPSIIALVFCLAVCEAEAQCNVTDYAILADARSRGFGNTDIVPGRNGELFVLLRQLDADTFSTGEITAAGDHLLLKYDRTYRRLWSVQLHYRGNVEIRLDSNGFPLISGVRAIVGSDSVYRTAPVSIVRLNEAGLVDHVIPISDVSQSSQDGDIQFAVGNDNVYIAAFRKDSNNIVIQKLDFEGNVLWRQYGYGPKLYGIHQIAVDGNDKVFISGAYADSVIFGLDILSGKPGGFEYQYFNYYLVKLDVDGTVLWTNNRIQTLLQTLGEQPSRQAMCVTDSNVYLVGYHNGSAFVNGTDTLAVGPLFLANITQDGDVEWVRSFNSKRPPTNSRIDISAANNGSVYISLYGGSIPEGILRFSATDSLVVDNASHIILKFVRTGDVTCGLNLPNSLFSGIGSDAGGTTYVAGFFREFAVFNPGDTLHSPVSPRFTAYLAKLGESPSGMSIEPSMPVAMAAWPNPVSGVLSMRIPESSTGSVHVRVNSLAGAVFLDGIFEPESDGTMRMNLATIPSGMYVVRAIGNRSEWVKHIVVIR